MALTFIYGNSGNGKSEYIYSRVTRQAEAAPYQRFFVVVPEQFTMHTQKRLTEHSANGVIMNIDVVSFERLAYRVFDELGIHPAVMEETGKSLVLRRIVAEHEKELTVLKGNLKKMSSIGELKSMISELMQYGVTPEELETFIAGMEEESALKYKISDILSVYRSFENFLQDHYVTAEKIPELLMEAADSSALLKDAVMIFDGYTGFTPVQLKLLQRLMHLVKEMYVTVTLDTGEDLYKKPEIQDLFFMSHKMVRALVHAAAEAGFELADPVMISENRYSRLAANPVLKSLEQNLFRTVWKPWHGSCSEQVRVYSAASPKQELQFAAGEIAQLVRGGGYRYRDFAIVSSNAEAYERYAKSIFDKLQIPFFADQKQTVLYHPLTELIRSVLELIEKDYSCESVFRYLRTGLTGFSYDEIDLLENYCIEKGVRGARRWEKRFLKPFRAHGRIKPDEEEQQAQLTLLNQLRERLWQQTSPIYSVFRQKNVTVKEMSAELYRFLTGLSAQEQMQEGQRRMEEAKEEILADTYRQIYRIVMDLLDKMVSLLGEEELTVRDYTDILEAGFSAAKVGSIPPGNDCVILGDIERTRLDGIRILFFLGVNDGQIPKNTEKGSLLSPYDREVLEEHSIELAPTPREQIFMQRFYLYLNMTKPSDALYLTFARMTADGKTARPSYLIGTMQKLFSELVIEELDAGTPPAPVTPESSLDSWLAGFLLARKGQVLPEWKALHKWLGSQQKWAGVTQRLWNAGFGTYQDEILEPDLARLLYGTVLTNSVTRLELFAKCAFAHFLEYGLKLSERREFTFENVDMGSMFHDILQRYCEKLEKAYSWESVTEQQQDAILEEAMEETVLSMPNEALLESARSAYILERIRRIMKRSVWALTEQIRRGDFRPEGYEVEFVQVSELDAGQLMRTVGRVDRIDTWEKEGRTYVRVIDYKSGKTRFQLIQLYYGMQLQLVVYMNAALEKLKKENPQTEMIPAGIFYYHLDDPMVEDSGKPQEEIMEDILRELRVNGLVSLDQDAYLHMDRELPEKRTSSVIPVALNKDMSVSGRSASAVPAADFGELSDYVNKKIRNAAEQILSGDIRVQPFELSGRTGCDYCSYRSICGFDPRIPGYQYRKNAELKDDEIWFRIKKENGEA